LAVLRAFSRKSAAERSSALRASVIMTSSLP
jgi:hypothetical protein